MTNGIIYIVELIKYFIKSESCLFVQYHCKFEIVFYVQRTLDAIYILFQCITKLNWRAIKLI